MDGFWNRALPAVLGLVGGLVGSLIGPWVQWGIEKRRSKLAFKREQIKRWRHWLNEYYATSSLQASAVYSEMRPYLAKHVVAAVEQRQVPVRTGRGGDVTKSLILDDIARIEREWDLI